MASSGLRASSARAPLGAAASPPALVMHAFAFPRPVPPSNAFPTLPGARLARRPKLRIRSNSSSYCCKVRGVWPLRRWSICAALPGPKLRALRCTVVSS
eukprot:2162384-Pyramimonas_sp.AAC.1